MDSLAFVNLHENAVVQIASLYPTDASTLVVKRLSVQQQNGYHDCGLYSIAFAMEVCLGQNPECVSFSQEKMRNHLTQCLCDGEMKPFPYMDCTERDCIPRPKRGALQIELFCFCKMPAQLDSEMIQCDSCQQWFHFSCVGVDNSSKVPEQWYCDKCSF